MILGNEMGSMPALGCGFITVHGDLKFAAVTIRKRYHERGTFHSGKETAGILRRSKMSRGGGGGKSEPMMIACRSAKKGGGSVNTLTDEKQETNHRLRSEEKN